MSWEAIKPEVVFWMQVFAPAGVLFAMLRAIWPFISKAKRAVDVILKELVSNGGTSISDKIHDINKRTQRSYVMARAIVASMDTAIFETDARGNVIYVNRAMELITEYPERDLIGLGWRNIVSSAHAAGVLDDYDAAIEEKRIIRQTFRMKTRNGRYVDVCLEANPLRVLVGVSESG